MPRLLFLHLFEIWYSSVRCEFGIRKSSRIAVICKHLCVRLLLMPAFCDTKSIFFVFRVVREQFMIDFVVVIMHFLRIPKAYATCSRCRLWNVISTFNFQLLPYTMKPHHPISLSTCLMGAFAEKTAEMPGAAGQMSFRTLGYPDVCANNAADDKRSFIF